ncbi:MAG: nicotinate phosphoribosyltransferase [Acholeplasmatales bacterium]|jgi:nicotinate phosphoribosyltransferase|nr:nicotinate phosphoribosyltransferase [Acholeplasmatales bacterium]
MEKKELIVDLYELTMADVYIKNNIHNKIAVFDCFFRKVPDNGSYAVFAGLERVVEFLTNLKFDNETINYLKGLNIFSSELINYLENFKFTCDVYSFKEGSLIFPYEPYFVVKGPLIQCQLIETFLLQTLNFECLIATKARRIVYAANNTKIVEFGARRAHSSSASILGSRACYLSGCEGTSNIHGNYSYNIPLSGTMSHSFIQSYSSEYEAFKAYALNFPDSATLLVDTYSVSKGVKNAILIDKEVLSPLGKRLKGIRIDSGDLLRLSHMARKLLDEEGLKYTQICVSNSLDEYNISDLVENHAPIDVFGIGERMITSKSDPIFNGVYKMSGLYDDDLNLIPKLKISESFSKSTLPSLKQVYRYVNEYNEFQFDCIGLYDRVAPSSFNRLDLKYQKERPLLELIIKEGVLLQPLTPLEEVRVFAKKEFDLLPEKYKNLTKAAKYEVLISIELEKLRDDLLKELKKNI